MFAPSFIHDSRLMQLVRVHSVVSLPFTKAYFLASSRRPRAARADLALMPTSRSRRPRAHAALAPLSRSSRCHRTHAAFALAPHSHSRRPRAARADLALTPPSRSRRPRANAVLALTPPSRRSRRPRAALPARWVSCPCVLARPCLYCFCPRVHVSTVTQVCVRNNYK